VYRYSLPKRTGATWLIGAMRFRTLWEYDGPHPVAVVDIHDDLKLQTNQVSDAAFGVPRCCARL
jgi:hypothetical protein